MANLKGATKGNNYGYRANHPNKEDARLLFECYLEIWVELANRKNTKKRTNRA